MPNIPSLMEERPLGHVEFRDTELVPQLEEAVTMWQSHIDATISACLGKVRTLFLSKKNFKNVLI